MTGGTDPLGQLIDATRALGAAGLARDADAMAQARSAIAAAVGLLTARVGEPAAGSASPRLEQVAAALADARNMLFAASDRNRQLLQSWSEITGIDLAPAKPGRAYQGTARARATQLAR